MRHRLFVCCVALRAVHFHAGRDLRRNDAGPIKDSARVPVVEASSSTRDDYSLVRVGLIFLACRFFTRASCTYSSSAVPFFATELRFNEQRARCGELGDSGTPRVPLCRCPSLGSSSLLQASPHGLPVKVAARICRRWLWCLWRWCRFNLASPHLRVRWELPSIPFSSCRLYG
jgi:hypothetical protein